jgi:hypothetical protein
MGQVAGGVERTVILNGRVLVNAPLTPCTVKLYVPSVIVDCVVMVKTEVADGTAEEGLKFAVIPAGSPIIDKATGLVKSPVSFILIKKEVPLPAATFCTEGDADKEKSGAPFTIRVASAE